MLEKVMDWLGRWEGPMAQEGQIVELVPATGAKGYQYYPVAMELARPIEKADFSKAPQLKWWLDEKRYPQTRAGVRG